MSNLSKETIDKPSVYNTETSPTQEGAQNVASPSEGSSEMETSSIDTSMRQFGYHDIGLDITVSGQKLPATAPQPQLLPPSSTPNLRMKPSNKKSFVWNYFRHPANELGVVDRSRTQCLLCKSQLAFNASGTTTTMLNHLKSRHGEIAQREESQKVRSGNATRRKDSSSSRNSSNSASNNHSYPPLRMNHLSNSMPQSLVQIQPSRNRQPNGTPEFPFTPEDLRRFNESRIPSNNNSAANNTNSILHFPPMFGAHGFLESSIGRQFLLHQQQQMSGSTPLESMEASVAAASSTSSVVFPPPPLFVGNFSGSSIAGTVLPNLIPPPSTLESSSLQELPVPPGFPFFLPPPMGMGENLPMARSWLSSFGGSAPVEELTNGRSSSSSPKNTASNAPVASPAFPFLPSNQLAAMTEAFLRTMTTNINGSVDAQPDSLTNLFANSAAKTQPPLIPPKVSSSDASINSIGPETSGSGTGRRKRTRPVYIPPPGQSPKRQSVSQEGPEDLSMPKMMELSDDNKKEAWARSLETRLAYFLVREMLPAEILDREGFKTKQQQKQQYQMASNPLSGAKRSNGKHLVNDMVSSSDEVSNVSAERMKMEVLPRIATWVRPPSAQEENRNSLAVEFWASRDGRNRFVNVSLGSARRLLQTALLRDSANVESIIINCFETVEKDKENVLALPRLLVTNEPERMLGILPADIVVIPCFITTLARAVMHALRCPSSVQLIEKARIATSNGASTSTSPPSCCNGVPHDTEHLSWYGVTELLERARAERHQGDLARLKVLLNYLEGHLDFVRQQREGQSTISLIAPMIFHLQRDPFVVTPEDSVTIRDFKLKIIEFMEKTYPRGNTAMYEHLLLASVTDPRMRARILELAPESVELLKRKVEELNRGSEQTELLAQMEVEAYLHEEIANPTEVDPRLWWREKKSRFPRVESLAKHFMAISLSSFNLHLRLQPLNRDPGSTKARPVDQLNLPKYLDTFARLSMELVPEEILMYTFLWHNWVLSHA